MLDLVAGHEPARARDDAPPREIFAFAGQQRAHRPGGSRETGLSRHLPIGHHLAGAQAPDDAADVAGELRGRRPMAFGTRVTAPPHRLAVDGVSCGSGDRLTVARA